jgi:precorrin-6B methylase 2
MIYIYWAVVVIFSALALLSITFVFLIARSFFREAPYVPLEKKAILQSLKLLNIKKGDSFIDIGSGDGRVIFHAVKESEGEATYTGIEIDPILVQISRMISIISMRTNRNTSITFLKQDALTFNYSEYNKVFMYLTTPLASEIVSKLLIQLPKGSTIVSAYFPVKVNDTKVDIVEKKYEISGKIRSFYIITT